jgi:hypothetical protein
LHLPKSWPTALPAKSASLDSITAPGIEGEPRTTTPAESVTLIVFEGWARRGEGPPLRLTRRSGNSTRSNLLTRCANPDLLLLPPAATYPVHQIGALSAEMIICIAAIIIPGQSGTYRHLHSRIIGLLAESGLTAASAYHLDLRPGPGEVQLVAVVHIGGYSRLSSAVPATACGDRPGAGQALRSCRLKKAAARWVISSMCWLIICCWPIGSRSRPEATRR